MSDQNKEELDQNIMKKGPGEQLQVARIEQDIAIEDIARQMNLNAKILQSIEDDDYSDIQSPIFVRGYLRTYARLVGLDEDHMIKLFGEYYQQEDPLIKAIGNTTPEISSNDIRVKWMTYAVIIGLLSLLSIWWVNNYRSTTMDVIQPQDESLTVDESNQSNSNSRQTDVTTETLSVTESSSMEVNAVSTEITVDENEENKADVIEGNEEDVLNTEMMDENSDSDPVEAEAVKVEDVKVKEKLEPVIVVKKVFTKEINAPLGSDVLELNIIASSWSNIQDASKFKLIKDLLKQGNTYRLVGQRPFKVFLGNGYGVEITLNGESYDFSKSINSTNNTARFEIGK